jgi:hypothetical protein
MRVRTGAAGPRGISLLAAAGVVAVLLASHGWAHRTAGGAPGSLAGRSGAAHVAPATSATSAPPKAGPSANTGAGAPGPLLTSQPFAQYSFVIWPGTPSAAAKAALTGLSVNVSRETSGLSVTAAVNGQKAGAAHSYPKGVRVYVVEATMGDDSGNADYNLGDDGIVVTDAQGRIIS